MNGEALQTRNQIVAAYLEQMQELAHEISAAMDAIAANALSSFQESVARQEMLCASLATTANAVSEGMRSVEPPALSGVETAVASRVRAAGKELRELNLQYAALLRHSGRSIAILASLCRSCTGRFQEARGSRSKYQTWSCEM
jgi:hypothetical protein